VAAGAQTVTTPDIRDTLLVGPDPVLVAADRAWQRRDEGRVGARASRDRISEAIAGYEKACEASENAEARWKLSRALFFEAKLTGLDPDAELALYERARKAGDESIAILRRRAPGGPLPANASPSRVATALARDPDAAPAYFWTAVAWGEWGLLAGKLQGMKTGAATRIRDAAATVIALDPTFEEAGGYRVLGRLHQRAPRIPYVTGWISKAEGLRNLRLAVRTPPKNFVNRHFLAEALAADGRAGRAEAIRIETEIVADAPSPGHLVEDIAIQDEAKKNLAAWKAGS
jgi:tetratricopeptide (TPR) repeat protein